mmetsp:Transcript_24752/g.71232  ORF Transcript_24752/g.71232 Transcript_24752/m.71232 type:complete len:358 (-) Transcript_24752:211-1284(-)
MRTSESPTTQSTAPWNAGSPHAGLDVLSPVRECSGELQEAEAPRRRRGRARERQGERDRERDRCEAADCGCGADGAPCAGMPDPGPPGAPRWPRGLAPGGAVGAAGDELRHQLASLVSICEQLLREQPGLDEHTGCAESETVSGEGDTYQGDAGISSGLTSQSREPHGSKFTSRRHAAENTDGGARGPTPYSGLNKYADTRPGHDRCPPLPSSGCPSDADRSLAGAEVGLEGGRCDAAQGPRERRCGARVGRQRSCGARGGPRAPEGGSRAELRAPRAESLESITPWLHDALDGLLPGPARPAAAFGDEGVVSWRGTRGSTPTKSSSRPGLSPFAVNARGMAVRRLGSGLACGLPLH